jgi:hypothetical protein
LILAAVLAALVSAPAPAWAQVAPGSGSDQRPAITPDMVTKILGLMPSIGMDTQLPAPVASALGLTVTGQGWPDRQFAVQANDTGTVHAIAVSRSADPDILFSTRGPAAITVFRLRRDGVLVSAINFFTLTRQTAVIPPTEARTEFTTEKVFWLTSLDALIAGN